MVSLRDITRLLILFAPVVLVSLAHGGGLEAQKLRILLSINETVSETDSTHTINWALSGQWRHAGGNVLATINLDSDYARSDTTTLDRLRTGWRFMPPDNVWIRAASLPPSPAKSRRSGMRARMVASLMPK